MMPADQTFYICRSTYRYLMTKTVALSDEAYDLLDSAKQPDESFSKAVIRIVKGRRPSVMDLCGIWKDDRDIEATYARLRKERRKYRLREVKL